MSFPVIFNQLPSLIFNDFLFSQPPPLRLSNHSRKRQAPQSGFLSKTSTETFTQRIILLNTKSIAIDNLKGTDTIPISEDGCFEVKLINPRLVYVPVGNTSSVSSLLGPATSEKQKPVRVKENIVAQWEGVDEKDFVGALVKSIGCHGVVASTEACYAVVTI